MLFHNISVNMRRGIKMKIGKMLKTFKTSKFNIRKQYNLDFDKSRLGPFCLSVTDIHQNKLFKF